MRSRSWMAVVAYLAALAALGPGPASADTLETFDDAELDKLIKQEQFVIVLFSKPLP